MSFPQLVLCQDLLTDDTVASQVFAELRNLGFVDQELSSLTGLLYAYIESVGNMFPRPPVVCPAGHSTFGHRFLCYLDLVAKSSDASSGDEGTAAFVLAHILHLHLGVSGLYDYFLGCCQCAKHYHPEEATDLWEQYLMGLRQHRAFPLSSLSPVLRSTPITRDDMLRHLRAFVTGVATWPT